MFPRAIVLGLAGLLLVTTAQAQDVMLRKEPLRFHHLAPRVRFESRHQFRPLRMALKQRRPMLRHNWRMEMQPLRMRNFQWRMRPKTQWTAGSVEI